MSALLSIWHVLSARLRYDRENAIAERAVRLAQLGDAERSNAVLLGELSEALDERDIARAAHHELAASYDEQREQLRAVQSELAQRAARDCLPRETWQRWLDAFERSGLSRHDALHIWAELAEHGVVPAAPRYAEAARALGVVERRRPFGESVVRKLPNGSLYFANQQAKGFASFGYEYGDWLELLTDWDVELTGTGNDEHGPYVIVRPAEDK